MLPFSLGFYLFIFIKCVSVVICTKFLGARSKIKAKKVSSWKLADRPLSPISADEDGDSDEVFKMEEKKKNWRRRRRRRQASPAGSPTPWEA